MLDVCHEMDGSRYPWGYGVNGNPPADLIAAYRHVHDRFALAGATNVQFVWNVNFWNYSGVDQRDFYPGDAYVDWMAVEDRKSTRLNSSHTVISYAVFCLKKKKK